MVADVFQGKIDGFPEISVDYFLDSRLPCSSFFLSHCHTDHIKGIDSQDFKARVQKHNLKIYCTEITANLVLRRSKLDYLKSSFVYLVPNESFIIDISQNNTINVTLLDANHCPGSVMFIFSKENVTALYTGDFRVTNDYDIQSKLNGLHVNSLYVDTTFFSPKVQAFREFPSREESQDAVIRFLTREKEKNDTVEVHIDITPGWENIFISVSNHFDCDIEAPVAFHDQYRDIESIVFYLSHQKSWVHVNQTNSVCGLCNDQTLKLRPSIQWKLHNNMMNSNAMIVARAGTENAWYVTHSMHCSYSECCKFIELVAADKVFPIATPTKMSNVEILGLLKKYWKKDSAISSIKPTTELLSNAENKAEITYTNTSFEEFIGFVSSESEDCLPVIVAEKCKEAKNAINSVSMKLENQLEFTKKRSEPKNTKVRKIVYTSSSDDEFLANHGKRKLHRKNRRKAKVAITVDSSSSEFGLEPFDVQCTNSSAKEVSVKSHTTLDLRDDQQQPSTCDNSEGGRWNALLSNPNVDGAKGQNFSSHSQTNSQFDKSYDTYPKLGNAPDSRIDKFLDAMISSDEDKGDIPYANPPEENKSIPEATICCSQEAKAMDRIMSQFFGFDSD